MKVRAAVTLSNENSPSRSRPCLESRPAFIGCQWHSCASPRPCLPSAVRNLGMGRCRWAR
jgi:hypothetical protein